MSTDRYESIKIPILLKADYPTWRVKMLMYLEAIDPDYIDKVNDGPYVPKKIVPKTPEVPEHCIPKVNQNGLLRIKLKCSRMLK